MIDDFKDLITLAYSTSPKKTERLVENYICYLYKRISSLSTMFYQNNFYEELLESSLEKIEDKVEKLETRIEVLKMHIARLRSK